MPVVSRVTEVLGLVQAASRRAVVVSAETYTEQVRHLMRDFPKSGKPGPVRQRSAPGEAPAVQFGDLIADIGFEVHREVLGEWVATCGYRTRGRIGIALEYGTRTIAPRPAWRPAVAPALALTQQRLATGRLAGGGQDLLTELEGQFERLFLAGLARRLQ
jgi:hypothetical protein